MCQRILCKYIITRKYWINSFGSIKYITVVHKRGAMRCVVPWILIVVV